MPEDLENIFTYHEPDAHKAALYQEIRRRALEFATFIQDNVPPVDERKQSVIRLEETVMWANAAVARH